MPSLFYEEYFPVSFFFRVLIYSILLLRFYIFLKCVFDAIRIYRIIYPKWFLSLGSITFFTLMLADFGSFALLMEDSSMEGGLSAEHQAAKPLPDDAKKPEEKPDVHKPINMGETDLSIVTRGKDTYFCTNSGKLIDNKLNDGSYVGQVLSFCSKTFKDAVFDDPFNNKSSCVLVQRNDEDEGFDSSTDPYRLANAHTQGQSVYAPDPRDPKLKEDK